MDGAGTAAVPITIAGSALWPSLVLDYVLAFTFGIGFQYFSIAPMRGLAPLPGIRAAVKGDVLAIKEAM